MPWPSDQDYNEAIQNPRIAFDDTDLQTGQVESYPTGIPKARSGNFAAVYKMFSNGTPYAVKCFRYDNPEYARRYPAIAAYLTSHPLSCFVAFRYVTRGIRVGATWYPILKMKWTEGESLISYIERNLSSSITLQQLASSWTHLLGELRNANIAHGDLQHGNVLVVGGNLKLVDYDGMYVPSLNGSRGLENGHRNYQHPERTDLDFGNYLDNFSAWLIYISILALSVRPGLWQTLKSGDECLLFRKQDLVAPEQSEAFRLLRTLPDEDVRDLVERFEEFLWLPPSRIPAITANPITPRSSQRSGSSATVPDWISDHLREFRSTSLVLPVVGEEETEIGDPSWIVDHIKPQKHIGSFQNRMRLDRLFAVVAFALAFGIAAWKSPADVAGTIALYLMNVVIAAGTTISFWRLRYFLEPVFNAVRASAIQLRDATRSVDENRMGHENLKKRRRQRKDSLSAGIQKANLAQNALEAGETKKCAEIDGWLKNALQQLHDKRRSLASDEANEKRQLMETTARLSQQINAISSQQQKDLNQLDWGLGQKIRGLEAQLQQVTSNRDLELRRALKEYQDQIVLSHLHRWRIAEHTIEGVGGELKRRLAQAGFVSAADVATRPINVPGIGAKKRASLHSWVIGLDNTFRPREAPKALPSHKTADIERRYEAPIRQLEQNLASDRPQFAAAADQIRKKYAEQKKTLEGELGMEETRVRQQTPLIEQEFEAQRNVLSGEEQQARELATKVTEEWKQQFRVQTSEIAAATERLRNEYASELENINKDLGAAAKCIREMCWRRDQAARDQEVYARLTFRHYCARALGARG
jgi:hypothetical protein